MDSKKKFDAWFETIKNDTFVDSHQQNIAAHEDTKNIIDMGMKSVPYIMEHIDEAPGICFYILSELGIERPFPLEDSGYVQKMIKAWKEWYNTTTITNE